jgi:hypothetical protein
MSHSQTKVYIRNINCSHFYTNIQICINESEQDFNLVYDHNGMDYVPTKYNLTGKIVMNEPNYKLIEIVKINKESFIFNPYIDMYLLNNKNITDDCTGMTDINIGCITYPKHFDCIISLNENIAWQATNNRQEDLLLYINNIKLLSVND